MFITVGVNHRRLAREERYLEEEKRARMSGRVFRFLQPLPIKVVNRLGVECLLEVRQDVDRSPYAILLSAVNGRTWVVRFATPGEAHEWDWLLYEHGLSFEGDWQLRLMCQLVGEGKAARIPRV